jgi:hypothetical protein
MLDRRTEPLEIAAAILTPETIRIVREDGYTASACRILDRWALNSPDALKRLEARGVMAFETRLNAQLKAEIDACNSESARLARQQGMSEYEFYQDIGIDLELRC